ncbi:hypothetical protein COD21_30455 [Bacillus cereus]|uniref:helix-turn-helix domain-containing protein n=1 Tax=Bacillus cereus TaxID=1396 RepID=UPI000BFCF936|nr:helix-turn-helix domain-containing protein [Bacillus cereus]PGU00839.1 hypothetical protein COD21_30455 [Bacillus cereus]
MDKFMHHLIHDKSTRRKIYILNTLNSSRGFVSSRYLADHLKCSSRTILNDISQLKYDISSKWELLSIKSKGHMLKKPLNENLNWVIQSYLKESTIYKIIIGLFQGRNYSLEKWAQILYINKETLKGILKKFNILLIEFRVKFKFRILKLDGDEINIRYFYIAFFYLIKKYGIEVNEQCSFIKGAESIVKSYGVKIDLNMLKSILFVLIKSYLRKNHIKSKIKIDIILDCRQSDCLQEIISELESYYHFRIYQSEKSILKLYFFLAANSTNLQKKKVFNLYYNVNNFHENLTLLFDILEKKNILNLFTKKKLTIELGIYIYKLYVMKQYDFPLQYFVTLLDFPSNDFTKLYKKIYFYVISWNKNNSYNKYELNYITVHITLFLYSNPKKYDILLLFSGTALEETIVYIKLKQKLGDNVAIHQISDAINEYDLIITNYKILEKNIPVFYIFQNGSPEELSAIKLLTI